MITKVATANKEEWKAVQGFEGLYEVSNAGDVRSLDRTEYLQSRSKHLFSRKRKGETLKQKADRYGYMRVVLWKEGKPHFYTVHRLVASAFINNTDQKDTIDHIDCDRKNNHVENLRWVTAKENLNYSHELGRQRINATPIVAISPSGITYRYPSQKEAARQTGVKQQLISRAVNGRKPNLFGWEFAYDYQN